MVMEGPIMFQGELGRPIDCKGQSCEPIQRLIVPMQRSLLFSDGEVTPTLYRESSPIIIFSPTLPYPTLPYPTLPYPTLPYPTLPYPTLPYYFKVR
jgi:hypothetical protein